MKANHLISENTESPALFHFPDKDRDRAVQQFAQELTYHLLKNNIATDEQKISLRQAEKIFSRLPEPTRGVNIILGMRYSSGQREYGWQISLSEQELAVGDSGIIHLEWGSDTFSNFDYEADTSGWSSCEGDIYQLYGMAAELASLAQEVWVEVVLEEEAKEIA